MTGVATRVRTLGGRVRKLGASRALILMYHRVADASVDPWGLAVSPSRFADQLAAIRECGEPVTLTALAAAHERGVIPRRGIVVTFDDGYADNAHTAKPLLQRAGIPASVFVTTAYTGTRDEFWWDELERLLLGPDTLPATLDVTIAGRSVQWDLGPAAVYAREDRRRDRRRRARDGAPGSRLAFYYAVWRELIPLEDEVRRDVLAAIASWAPETPRRESHRALAPDELVELARDGLVDVGAHTATHPHFPAQPAAVQRRELAESKGALEDVLGRRVTTFAYPFGEWSPESPALAREAGFVCACAVANEPVWRGSDRYRLPRFGVEDWTGEDLARRLHEWFRR